MGMSTHIRLLRDRNDSDYQKNLKVLLACKEAEVELPKEVDEYFGGFGTDANPEEPLEIEFEAREWGNDCSQGYEIDIVDLPKGVRTIRFYNSW